MSAVGSDGARRVRLSLDSRLFFLGPGDARLDWEWFLASCATNSASFMADIPDSTTMQIAADILFAVRFYLFRGEAGSRPVALDRERFRRPPAKTPFVEALDVALINVRANDFGMLIGMHRGRCDLDCGDHFKRGNSTLGALAGARHGKARRKAASQLS